MTRTSIGERGEVTLPRKVLEATRTKPGDMVEIEAAGPRTIVLRILPGPADVEAPQTEQSVRGRMVAGEHGEAPITYDELPVLTLHDMFERFRIDGPVDFEADREAISSEMAKDVFGERPDRFPA